jgi:hypothetical protein
MKLMEKKKNPAMNPFLYTGVFFFFWFIDEILPEKEI